MPRHNSLAQLELFVLLCLYRLGGRAFSGAIRNEIDERTGRGVSLASVYVTLTRLEDRGYVESQLTEPRPVPGGRARKRFALSAAGIAELQTSTTQLRGVLEGLPQELVLP